MVILVLPIIIAGVVCLCVGGALGSKWEDIQYGLRGKRIAILGERKVGKTTLWKYMGKGCLIERYSQTMKKQEIERFKLKIDELEIRIRVCDDVSGSETNEETWNKVFEGSNLVLYMLRSDKLFNQDQLTVKRCNEDLEQMHLWIQANKDDQKIVFIVGNHWSSDPMISDLEDQSKRGYYKDRFEELEVVRQMRRLAGGQNKVQCILGSLDTEENAQKLVTEIFKQYLDITKAK